MRTAPSAWQCATILEFGKHVLDFVPVFLQCLVVTDAAGLIGTGRDEGNDPLRLQRGFELIYTLGQSANLACVGGMSRISALAP